MRRREVVLAAAALAVAGGLTALAVALSDDGAPPASAPPPGDLPDIRNGRSFIQDNLWSTATDQYAVWVRPDGTPMVGKRARPDGDWEVTDLADVAGNPLDAPVADDEHNVFAIAVDSLGYVHVAGNMHDDPMRYVRSTTPGDITAWEPASVPGPVDEVTYPSFVRLPDGTLQFWWRSGFSGDGAVVMAALPPGEQVWQPRGTVIDGRPSGESPYLHRIAVDPATGAEHVLFEWRANGDPSSNNDVGYARSTDGGATWTTSTGSALATPITHATAETVLDTPDNGSGLLNGGGFTVDADGLPHGIVTFESSTVRRLVHVWRDDGDWHQRELPGDIVAGRPAIVALPDGQLWLLGIADNRVHAVDITAGEPGDTRSSWPVPHAWEVVYDSEALALDGRVETLVPAGPDPAVLTVLP